MDAGGGRVAGLSARNAAGREEQVSFGNIDKAVLIAERRSWKGLVEVGRPNQRGS